MTKSILTVFLLMAVLAVNAQTIADILKPIHNENQANDFIERHMRLSPQVFKSISGLDTAAFDRLLLSKPVGEIFTADGFTYKILCDAVTTVCRGNYIYLDGSKLTLSQIDLIRDSIILQLGQGVSFAKLVTKYNMDGNPTGDLGWVNEKMLVQEVEDAFIAHKKGDIFKIDVPSNKWYYIMKKTYNEKKIREVTVLKVKGVD